MARTTLAALVVLALALPAPAQHLPGDFQTHAEGGPQPARTLGSGRTLWLFPASDVHLVYIADPHRPVNAAEALIYTRTGILDLTTAGRRWASSSRTPRPGSRSASGWTRGHRNPVLDRDCGAGIGFGRCRASLPAGEGVAA